MSYDRPTVLNQSIRIPVKSEFCVRLYNETANRMVRGGRRPGVEVKYSGVDVQVISRRV